MTGPEHAAEAQRLLVAATNVTEHVDTTLPLAAAQAHATLALAAATAARDTGNSQEWREVFQ